MLDCVVSGRPIVLGKRLRGDAKRRTPVEPVLDDVTVSVPVALVAPVAATEKSI